MDRKQMIEQLLRNELVWLHENFNKHTLAQVVEFLTDRGFHALSDTELRLQYDRLFKEEV